MSTKGVRKASEIRSAYEQLIQQFRIVGESVNCEVVLPSRPVQASFTESRSDASVAFKTLLYLRGWRCRHLASGKRLDIVIKVEEAFLKPSWCLTKSRVVLNYIIVSNSSAKLAQSLRYDFVDNGQPDHPFFHVHLSDEIIQDDELPSMGFRLGLAVQPNECRVTTRIPTPDMTLASVLYCVVADHVGAGQFREFAEKVHSIQDRLSHPGFEALKQSLKIPLKHFKSSHWFAHMR
ncbi:MAG: hypothetical protein ABSD56_01140 [Bryobacteraceae bacterium]